MTAALLGLTGAIVFGGIGTLAMVALWAVLFPALRDLDRFDVAHRGDHGCALFLIAAEVNYPAVCQQQRFGAFG